MSVIVDKLAAVALVTRGATVLSVWNRRFQTLALPGGKVEEGEEPEQAFRRELREETGLTSIWYSPVPIYSGTSSVDPERFVLVFQVTWFGGEPYEAEAGCPIAWVTPQELVRRSGFYRFYLDMFRTLSMLED